MQNNPTGAAAEGMPATPPDAVLIGLGRDLFCALDAELRLARALRHDQSDEADAAAETAYSHTSAIASSMEKMPARTFEGFCVRALLFMTVNGSFDALADERDQEDFATDDQIAAAMVEDLFAGIDTGTVLVPAVDPDPFLAFLTEWERRSAVFEALPDKECEAYHAQHLGPMNCAVRDGQIPDATTFEGAAAALRKAMSYSDMEDADASLVRAALAFLEKGAAR